MTSHSANLSAANWLVGGGEMGKLIRSMDWSLTPLGPLESWPASLRTTVNLALNSNFPISLAWGPHHIQIYNDGYWPLCAAKHPTSMGQDFTACWASAWPAIGAAFTSALAGTTSFLEDQRMFLDRLGYLEETFFTFSFSPIYDESGHVAGLFHPVTETTSKMVGQRRTRVLRDLADHAAKAQSLEEGLALAAQTLADAALDLPFVLFYQLDPAGRVARLVAQAGLVPDGPASPARVELTADPAGWPLAQVAAEGRSVLVEDVRDRFPGLVCGPYPEPIATAFVQPIQLPVHERPICLMVAGVSTRLPLNETYHTFFDLLAAAVTTVIANAVAYQAETQRADALAAIDRAKTAFFSNISHEFRTPLTLLLAPLEDELAEPATALPPLRRERLELAYRNSLRLLKLVNSLLDFARIEAGRVQAVYEPIDLAALTVGLASNFHSACVRAGLHLRIDCPPLAEPVYVDHDLWEKIVLNLMSNAFKFTFAGEIAVNLKTAGETVELAVRDTGTGIPATELTRIFDRFHRVKGAPGRTHEGSGIGLALVKELVALHGGSIRVESVLGQGSTFTVAVPIGKDHLPAERIGASRALDSTALGALPFVEEVLRWLPASPPPATTADLCQPESVSADDPPPHPVVIPATGSRPRIVWADDNADMRDYVCRLLSPRYEVEAVADGAAALAAVRRAVPDLVLTDVMMPRLDGFGLLQALRADERTRAVSIILLSARAGEEARIEGLTAGADGYLVKPFSARELLAQVDAHIKLAQLRREAEAARRAVEQAAALRASEAQLRLITDAMPALIAYVDADQRYRFNNRAYIEWFGRSRNELYGQRIEDIIGNPAYQAIAEHIEMTLAGVPVSYETVLPYKDGGTRFVHADYVPDVEAGQVKGFYVLVYDITERKQTEDALRDSRAQLAGLIESAMDGIITVDAEQRVVLCNKAAATLFGCTVADAIGSSLARFIPTRSRAAHADHLANFGNAGITSRAMGHLGLVSGLRRDGSEFPLEASISQLTVGGRKLFTAILRDITEREQAVAEIRRLNADLEQRVALRTQELEAANRELESFSYSVSHDLRAPLRHIQGYVEMLTEATEGLLSAEAQRYLAVVVNASKHMSELIDDLLSFSRMARATLHETTVSLDDLVQQVIRNLEMATRNRPIDWIVPPLPRVIGDPAMLKQVLANLLNNAVKYTRPRDPARIELGCAGAEDGRLVLFVRDNGVGFDMQYAHKLFGVFQRLHRADEFEGTGIGLANVARVITRHGGRVWAEAAPNQGATFYFTLQAGGNDLPASAEKPV